MRRNIASGSERRFFDNRIDQWRCPRGWLAATPRAKGIGIIQRLPSAMNPPRQLGFWENIGSVFARKEHVLRIPTVKKSASGMGSLAALRQGCPDVPVKLVMDFTECTELSLSAVVFLGGARESQHIEWRRDPGCY